MEVCYIHLYSWDFEGEWFDARIGQSVTLHELHLCDVTAALGEERQGLVQPLRRVRRQLEHERRFLAELIRQDVTFSLWWMQEKTREKKRKSSSAAIFKRQAHVIAYLHWRNRTQIQTRIQTTNPMATLH